MGFETYFLLLPSGAGGYLAGEAEARAATRMVQEAWLLGVRALGQANCPRGRRRLRVVTLTLLHPIGRPDPDRLPRAMEHAGQRLGVVLRLPPDRHEGLRAGPAEGRSLARPPAAYSRVQPPAAPEA